VIQHRTREERTKNKVPGGKTKQESIVFAREKNCNLEKFVEIVAIRTSNGCLNCWCWFWENMQVVCLLWSGLIH